jgi:hypothetical protein
MIKNLLVLVTLAITLQAFTIEQETLKPLTAIPWPFTICGTGDWTIKKLTLAQNPARNINDDIDVVNILLRRLE